MNDTDVLLNNLIELQKGSTAAMEAVADQLEKSNTTNSAILAKMEAEDEAKKKEAEEAKEVEAIEKFCTFLEKRYPGLTKSDPEGAGADSKEEAATLEKPSEDPQKPVGSDVPMPEQGAGAISKEDEDKDDIEIKEDEVLDKEDNTDKKVDEEDPIAKSLAAMNKVIQDRVDREVTKRLQKAGWREERNLVVPRSIVEGSGDVDTIAKSDGEDNLHPDKLKNLSYSQLRKMQLAADPINPEDMGLWTFDR